MQRVGLVYHPLNERALDEAQRLAKLLAQHESHPWMCSAWEPEEIRAKMGGTELIITAGGDGTILRVAQVVAEHGIPIIGVNLGKLGFMTELTTARPSGACRSSSRATAGWTSAPCWTSRPTHKLSHGIERFHALNDVVLARGEIARIVYIQLAVDGQRVTTYKTDGVVVSTATGCTGYALAGGGPVLHPQAADYLVVPIAPHLSLSYPLVINAGSEIRLTLNTTHQATLSIDGHISMPLCDGDSLVARVSKTKVKFLRLRPQNYFYSTLEHKLRGTP